MSERPTIMIGDDCVVPCTASFGPDFIHPTSIAHVRNVWLGLMESCLPFPRATGMLEANGIRSVLGLLCQVCHNLKLVHVTKQEFQRELPPYSVCLLAGISFDEVYESEALGGDVDFITRINDSDEYTSRSIVKALRAHFDFEDSCNHKTDLRIKITRTPSLGEDGILIMTNPVAAKSHGFNQRNRNGYYR